MSRKLFRWMLPLIASVLMCSTSAVRAQSGAKNGEWRTYGGDLGHTRVICAANFLKCGNCSLSHDGRRNVYTTPARQSAA